MRNMALELSLLSVTILVLSSLVITTFASNTVYVQSTVIFDFDTGSPPLGLGSGTPFNYSTLNGVTGRFSSPMDVQIRPAYSIQNYGTTGYVISTFSGNYLWLSGADSSSQLEIHFNRTLTSVNFLFATMEYHGAQREPSLVTLIAYMDSTATAPIGNASARGTWPGEGTLIGDTYPQGELTFNSDKPFNLVKIVPPRNPLVAGLLIDNIVVVAFDPTLDNTPPVTDLKLSGTIGNQGWHTSDVIVSLSAIDNRSGVNRTEYSFDNTNWILYQIPFAISTEGATTIYYRSTDNAGNIEMTNSRIVKIDITAPTIGVPRRIPQNDVPLGEQVKISVNATDTFSGLAEVILKYSLYNGTTWQPPIIMSYNPSINSYEATIPPQYKETWVKYKIIATDNAGNQAVSENTRFFYVYVVTSEFPLLLFLPLTMLIMIIALLVVKRRHSGKGTQEA
ncbi:MAG: hypothetical protein QW134_00005 [Nitrososphaeria archaeon]